MSASQHGNSIVACRSTLSKEIPVMCAGKAAKFLGKLGRRVARSKHGGGGTADAAPTPLINDAYGGTPGCASA